MTPPDCLPPRPPVVHDDTSNTMKGIGAFYDGAVEQPDLRIALPRCD